MSRRRKNVNEINDKINDKKKIKKKGNKVYTIIISIIFIFVMIEVYLISMYTLNNRTFEDMFLYKVLYNNIAPKEPVYIEESYELNLLALGDIYTSKSMLNLIDDYDFTSYFKDTLEYISKYDVRLASLNTPISESNYLNNGYRYNAPEEVIEFIKSLNLKCLLAASNHMYDKGELGVNETISVLDENNINYLGINEKSAYIIDENNIKLGILSYTTESEIEYLESYSNINTLTEEKLKQDLEYFSTNNVDYIISYVSIPNEDTTLVNSVQKKNVELLFENGVDIVLGVGSKIVKEDYIDIYELQDGSNKEVYVAYGLGDLLGNTSDNEELTSIGLDITFTKDIVKDEEGNIVEEKTKTDFNINENITLYNDISKYQFYGNYLLENLSEEEITESLIEIKENIKERLN